MKDRETLKIIKFHLVNYKRSISHYVNCNPIKGAILGNTVRVVCDINMDAFGEPPTIPNAISLPLLPSVPPAAASILNSSPWTGIYYSRPAGAILGLRNNAAAHASGCCCVLAHLKVNCSILCTPPTPPPLFLPFIRE